MIIRRAKIEDLGSILEIYAKAREYMRSTGNPTQWGNDKPKKELLKIINNKTFNDKTLFELESDFHTIKVVENEIGKFFIIIDNQFPLINILKSLSKLNTDNTLIIKFK